MVMIDIHIHILPHLDDGARDLDEALDMARQAVAEGVTTVIATPHGPKTGLVRNYSPELVRQRVRTLREALDEHGIPLEVLSGTELNHHPDLPVWLQQQQVLTLNDSRTVLLEFPNNATRADLDAGLAAVQQAGYRVVLAHPERIKQVQEHPDLLIALIGRGVLMQLTGDTLLGLHGEKMRQRAEQLLTHHMIHILASDAHDRLSHRPQLGLAYQRAVELIGAEAAQALVWDTPDAILHDQPIALPKPTPIHRSLITRFF